MTNEPKYPLKIYLVSSNSYGYDEYDSFVVVASSPKQARILADEATYTDEKGVFLTALTELLGYAKPKQKAGVVLGSFNAG